MLGDSVRHLLSYLTNGARHFPSRLANGACHLSSGLADGACRLARSSLCRRHRCSPLLFDVPICTFRVNALLFADFAVVPGKSITSGNLSTRNLSAGPGPLAQPTGSTRCKRALKNYAPQSSAL